MRSGLIRVYYLLILSGLLLGSVNLRAQKAVIGAKEFNKMANRMAKGTVPDLNIEQLPLQAPYVLLDCREAEEFTLSHIAGARWIGYQDFSLESLKDLPKDTTIVTYCTVGWRSERIGEKLQKAGYVNVYNLRGSILDWVNRGKPLVDRYGSETDSVHTYNRNFSKYARKGRVYYPGIKEH